MDQTKRCTRCERSLPYDSFSKNRAAWDGLKTRCKACSRELRGSVLQRRPNADRDIYGKTCPKCRIHKPWAEYQKSNTVADGHQSYCKPCAYEYEMVWDKAHPEIIKARHAEKLARQVHPEMTKNCTKCGKRRPHIEFYAHRSSADGRSSRCRECALQYQRQWNIRNRSKIKQYNAARAADPVRKRDALMAATLWRYRRYGLTPKLYDALLIAQDNKCAICGVLGNAWDSRNLSVDHDHITNEVRGLLCHGCNWGLGHFKDSTALLLAAVEYLKKSSAKAGTGVCE